MFAAIARHARIVVSGPHRSGTTICAEMIAHDTGHRVVREEEFGFSDWKRFLQVLVADRIVVQAPFFAHAVHYQDLSHCFIVFMRRDPQACARSQSRMRTAAGVPTGLGVHQYRMRAYHGATCVDAVYESWTEQRTRCAHLEVDFDSLCGHPLWIAQRDGWHHRRTAA
jgi:hypothetical protein